MQQQQQLIVLTGLPGSGKSTFTAALIARRPEFVRVSQDALGNRPRCEKLARSTLAAGVSAVIDRTNIDAKQRGHWLKIASNSGRAVRATAIYFQVDPNVCINRIRKRTEHETNPSPAVVNMMKNRVRAPQEAEGFAEVLVVASDAEIAALVECFGGAAAAGHVLGGGGGEASTGTAAGGCAVAIDLTAGDEPGPAAAPAAPAGTAVGGAQSGGGSSKRRRLSSFKLRDLTPGGGAGEIDVPPGTIVMGRGGQLGIDNPKISRKHVSFAFSEADGSVTACQLGANAIAIRRGTAPLQSVRRNEPYAIEDGDVLYMLNSLYPFQVLLQ